MWFVYILSCADKTLYIGVTANLHRRIKEHTSGSGADYTSRRLPIKLLYSEEFSSQSKALARELQLKGWSVKKKLALINGKPITKKKKN